MYKISKEQNILEQHCWHLQLIPSTLLKHGVIEFELSAWFGRLLKSMKKYNIFPNFSCNFCKVHWLATNDAPVRPPTMLCLHRST